MADDMVTYCIECGKEIRLSSMQNTCLDRVLGVGLKKKMLASGIEKIFYCCPNCEMEYTVMLTDADIRTLMKKRELLRGYANIRNKGVREQKQKEFEKLNKEIKAKMDKLNQR